ncbi:unnamed protein product [Arabidopsis halleri]
MTQVAAATKRTRDLASDAAAGTCGDETNSLNFV